MGDEAFPVPPSPPTDPAPPVPSIGDQRAAISDTALQAQQSSDFLDRALAATSDEVIAVIPKPWALDAQDQPVATTLAVSGSQLTMSIANPLPAAAYPVVADPQMIVADSVDEYVTQKADADTADYTDAEADAFDPPAGSDLPPPTPAPFDPDTPEPDDPIDPSALSSDYEDDVEGSDVQVAEADAARNARTPTKPQINSTESHPALFFSPDRQDLGFKSYRPIVPWKVLRMMTSSSPKVRRRAKLWSDWARIAKKGNTEGVKSQEEKSGGIRTDVALQFEKGETRVPRASEYQRELRRFLAHYGNVVGNLSPWNEPQLKGDPGPNPTRSNPLRAARYWVIAQALCHPAGGASRCGNVVAGEFAGTQEPARYKLKQATRTERRFDRTGNYEADYRDYLFAALAARNRRVPKNLKLHVPKVWGFHAYSDLNAYEIRSGGRAKVSERLARQFARPEYRSPRVWMTAAGAYYHRPCDATKGTKKLCENTSNARLLLFGERRQADALATYIRRLSLYVAHASGLRPITRLYYYHLHNVPNAGAYKPATPSPGDPLFPTDIDGRNPNREEEWGLVGNASDGSDAADPTVVKHEGTTSFSVPGRRRLAHCVLRDRLISRNRPKSCG